MSRSSSSSWCSTRIWRTVFEPAQHVSFDQVAPRRANQRFGADVVSEPAAGPASAIVPTIKQSERYDDRIAGMLPC